MKKITKLTLLLGMFLAWGSLFSNVLANTYCQTPITATDNTTTVKLSCQLISPGNYQIKVESDVAMTNFAAGVYCNINGVGGNQVISLPGYVRSADGKTITVDIPSTSAPNLYTPLYILMPGEKNFAWPAGITWGVCASGPADTVLPVMGSASVVGTPTYNSATLLLAGTDDVTNPVVNFVANDAANGITNRLLTANVSGNATVTGLNPGTTYNLTIKARDAAGNVSANSQVVTFTTAVRSSECSGERGHFGNPTVKKINYTIQYIGGNVIYTVTPIDAARTISFCEVQTTSGNNGMTVAADGKSATYTKTGLTIGANLGVLFMYRLDNMPGNEMTAQNSALTDANSIFYKVGECGLTDTEAPTAFTASNGAVTSGSVELLLNATDNLGVIAYTISYGNGPTVVNTTGTSGNQTSHIITGLTPSTAYSFSVVAKDAAGNTAANSPIVVNATTTAGLSTPAPTPTVASAQVKSIYSDAYTGAAAVTGLNLNPGWGQATQQSIVQVGTDNVLRYVNFNYQGTTFDNIFPIASGMKYLHIDIWTETETSVKIFPICRNAANTGNEPEKFKNITLTSSDQGVWKSYDIPLTDFTTQGLTMQNVYQFKLEGTGGKTIYFDNLYFWTDVAPSLVVSAATLNIGQPANSTNTFDITTTSSWTIASNQTWLTPSITSGSGNATITLTATSANETYFPRTAEVTVSGSGTTKTVVVTQAPTLPVAAPVPTITADKVMSVYSDTYTNLPTELQNWYGNNFSTVMLSGNTTLKNVTTCCFGYQFTGGAINITGMTKLHVDIYPLASATMTLGVTGGGEFKKTGIALVANQWNSVEVLLSELTGANLANVVQVGFWDMNATFYLDNLYFYSDATTDLHAAENSNAVSVYPNPAMNQLTINAKSEISQVVVRNLLGQSVKSIMVSGLEKTIDLSDVSAGNYFVTIKLANGQLSTQKIVKL